MDKRYYYRDDYVTPDPRSVLFMNSQLLKVTMLNEAVLHK